MRKSTNPINLFFYHGHAGSSATQSLATLASKSTLRYSCGEIKHGAFNLCPKCNSIPNTDENLALSLALTDHYFDKNNLDKMSQTIKSGEKINLDIKTKNNLIEQLKVCFSMIY